ncbi:MAG: hypothetical protein AB1546_12315, partial [bacterium]
KGLRELFIDHYWVVVRLLLMPFLKLLYIVIVFYFILMFWSLNTLYFIGALAAVFFVMWARGRFAAHIPSFVPRGLFVWYVFLVLISAAYVQSFNRFPPEPAACESLHLSGEIRPVLPMKEYRKHSFLNGALPYDMVLDEDDRAIFVSFKNLSGAGAIVRLDDRANELAAHLVVRSDRETSELFYPERLCINKVKNQLYATTKSNGNFQIIALDYGDGGLGAVRRLKFTNRETTNCAVKMPEGDLYVIFLGPPNNWIQVLDGKKLKPVSEIQFGIFGYADYFEIDALKDRLLVPSLDPTNLFKIYEVLGLSEHKFRTVSYPLIVNIPLFFGYSFPVSIPTLGVAHASKNHRFYLSSPFAQLVLELDDESMKVRRFIRSSGNFPRELAFNAQKNLLLVANYGSGTVDVVDAENFVRIKTYRLGKLVRSVYVSPDSGRNFAVTACGVFELELK